LASNALVAATGALAAPVADGWMGTQPAMKQSTTHKQNNGVFIVVNDPLLNMIKVVDFVPGGG
jgi:hypothetical protein